jgi:fibronectin-binding autotransporter adhesin
VTLRGNTSLATGKTFTAGLGATSGTGGSSAVNVAVASGLTTGTLLNVDTGTSAFTGNAVSMTSSGTFTGTLFQMTADSTTAGTVLGIHTNALQTGAVINADLGASIYTGTAGALRLIANSASTGTLLAISGTTLAANGGNAAQITLGVPGGAAEPAEGKAIRVALGGVGDAVYANAAAGFAGSFERYQVAGVDVLNVTATNITTTNNISQTGATTFSTGTGAISLNGAVTLASGKGITSAGGAANFDFHNSTGTFQTGTGNISLNGSVITNITQTGATTFSTGTGAISLNGAVTLASGKGFTSAGGAANFDFSASTGTFLTGTGNISLNGSVITNITQTGATTFSTGTGAIALNGAVTLASGKGITSAGGAANLDFSASTGTFQTGTGNISLNGSVITNITQTGTTTFSTGTGAISLNGAVTLASGKGITSAGGTANFDFSGSNGTFKTSTGAVSLSGTTTVTGANTFTVNGGLTSLKLGLNVTGGALNLGSAGTGPVHIVTAQQTAPTLANGTGATCTNVGTVNDTAGQIQVVVTTTGTSVPICTMTFNSAYASTPNVFISPGNAATATWFRTSGTNPFVTTTTTTWVLNANATAQGAGTYLIYYFVIE